ncbi:MAG: DUF4136 domain-containing protein [Acidobacteriota bacterium]|jgi:hypothetical protein
MRFPPRSLHIALCLLVFCGTAWARIQVDFDTTVYFGRYRVYAWMEGTPAKDPEAEAAIHAAVTRELAERGLSPAGEDQEPDLIVVTHATLGGPWALDPDNFAYGGYPEGGWGVSDPKPAEAVLLIDLLDAPSMRIVWRGIVVDSMPKDPDKLAKKIDRYVHKMLKKLPPR